MSCRARLAVVAVLAALAGVVVAPGAALAASYVPINGAGSTWSEPAVTAWAGNVAQFNMQVGYSGTGSTDGRKQFANGKVEFGISEIPYGLPDSATRDVDSPPTGRGYAYMPIVAGGTAFMYNLTIGGQRVTNLRLSGDTIVKIFTNKITYWDDPAIKADNPKLALPKRKIIPVVRSDGSGTTAQFTLWMSKRYQAQWAEFCRANGRTQSPCGLTSYFPVISGKNVGQSGSTGVAGYVVQPQYEGAITYVEYAYAIGNNFPVVKLLNEAKYYVEPTANSVAVAMTQARINADLTQNLDAVYTHTDPRAYPLSSYSYMILPTDERMGMNTAKGYTLASFAYYFLCKGQSQVVTLGYSPLPKNLVEEGVKQVKRVPGNADAAFDISKCANPTFSSDGTNLLAVNAQRPPDCDKQGPDQCATGTGGAPASTRLSGGGGGTGSQSPGAAAPSASASVIVDPVTAEAIAAGGAGGGSGSDVAGVPVSLDRAGSWDLRRVLMVVAGVLLLALIVGPPLLARSLGRTGSGGGDR
ncbi:phosphate ABC transporter substrate-binding protein PstS [Dactylosporangium fulvum]|uniref:phosphate ABC transporter substrate-binding protein PstS n=1 Tax=Dactylosporangium fulvum TaxID=53359 RepID=UPI0031DD6187